MAVSDRGVSSVVDAAFFTLFVGAAVVTLTLPAGTVPDGGTADATADVLATSTADVEYTLAPGARRADEGLVTFPWESGPSFRRTAHGTLAEHLAAAAVGDLAVDGVPVSHTRDDFERAVRNATRNATRNRDERVRVRAVWHPYPGAPVRGTVAAGPTPPSSAAVHTAVLTVASGFPSVRERARTAARGGTYAAVAEVVATATVRGVFPPNATRQALLADYPVNRLVDYRYRRFGALLGVGVSDAVSAADGRRDVETANERLTAALAERLATDMRRRFETPAAAARAVRVGQVRVTVRTWSP